MKRSSFAALIAGFVFSLMLIASDYSYAFNTDFHGHLKSNYVLRDTNGFQNKFMDSVTCSQWLTELKFDLTIRPEDLRFGNVQVSKIFLTYRGAYDAVFDVTDKWDNVRDKSPDDFELGKDDLKVENDLREAFVDLISEFGEEQSLVLRLGRQIVQWGEADGFNVVNIINPQDNSNKMFFDKPEDLAIPLWMARLDYSTGAIGPLNTIDLELVLIPDIRPHQFAPLGSSKTDPYDACNAPYAFGFKALKDWGIPALTEFAEPLTPAVTEKISVHDGLSINDGSWLQMYKLPEVAEMLRGTYDPMPPIDFVEDVPSSNFDNMEYGGKIRMGYLNHELTLYYLRVYQDDPAINLSHALTDSELIFEHPKQHMYGFSFNTFVPSINAVIRGEANIVSKMSFGDFEPPFTELFYGTLPETLVHPALLPLVENNLLELGLEPSMKGYTMHRVYQSLLGFDKSFWARWLNSHNMINASLQAYWRHISDFDYDPVYRPWDQPENYRLTGFFWTDYCMGKLHPEFFVMYDTEDAWMTNLSLKITKDGRWIYKFGFMAFWGEEPNGNGTSANRYSKNATGPFTVPVNLINISELSFTISYNW